MTAAFDKLSELVRRTTGIVLDPDKRFVVESRLLPVARAHGFGDINPMMLRLIESGDPLLAEDVIDALTTNETFFFRDRALFDIVRGVVAPYLVETRARERQLRIWCNACSTGQEPYSLAMLLDEHVPALTGWRIDLQATDVSKSAIRAARDGLYNKFEVQRGLPAHALLKYFEPEGARWRIADRLRSAVKFSNFNLLRPFDERGEFDVIFCRNVLIYFDQDTKRDILTRLARSLRKDGFLVLGSTESTVGAGNAWTRSEASPLLFVRADSPHAARQDLAAAARR